MRNTNIEKSGIPPIKEFLLPGKEELFDFDQKTKKTKIPKPPKKITIFGLNSRDLEALAQLDEIMAKPKPDYFYLQKRKAVKVISKPGFDEAVEAGLQEVMPKLRKLLLDPELLHDAVKWSWNPSTGSGQDKIWEKLGKQCIGCGICTYVCPLCYCFSMEDTKCTRTRHWTSCVLPEFSKITGGHTFHKTLKERYYNWYYHKFVRAYKEYGKSQCVACGRCQKYCPAKIDIEKVLVDIVGKYEKSLPAKTS